MQSVESPSVDQLKNIAGILFNPKVQAIIRNTSLATELLDLSRALSKNREVASLSTNNQWLNLTKSSDKQITSIGQILVKPRMLDIFVTDTTLLHQLLVFSKALMGNRDVAVETSNVQWERLCELQKVSTEPISSPQQCQQKDSESDSDESYPEVIGQRKSIGAIPTNRSRRSKEYSPELMQSPNMSQGTSSNITDFGQQPVAQLTRINQPPNLGSQSEGPIRANVANVDQIRTVAEILANPKIQDILVNETSLLHQVRGLSRTLRDTQEVAILINKEQWRHLIELSHQDSNEPLPSPQPSQSQELVTQLGPEGRQEVTGKRKTATVKATKRTKRVTDSSPKLLGSPIVSQGTSSTILDPGQQPVDQLPRLHQSANSGSQSAESVHPHPLDKVEIWPGSGLTVPRLSWEIANRQKTAGAMIRILLKHIVPVDVLLQTKVPVLDEKYIEPLACAVECKFQSSSAAFINKTINSVFHAVRKEYLKLK